MKHLQIVINTPLFKDKMSAVAWDDGIKGEVTISTSQFCWKVSFWILWYKFANNDEIKVRLINHIFDRKVSFLTGTHCQYLDVGKDMIKNKNDACLYLQSSHPATQYSGMSLDFTWHASTKTVKLALPKKRTKKIIDVVLARNDAYACTWERS